MVTDPQCLLDQAAVSQHRGAHGRVDLDRLKFFARQLGGLFKDRATHRSLSATKSASSWLVSGSSRPNSSPPRRAKVSVGRRTSLATLATRRNASSPALCPSASLIALKLSTSNITIDTSDP